MNTVGSFRCNCKVGTENFEPYKGCSDIDECAGIKLKNNVNKYNLFGMQIY